MDSQTNILQPFVNPFIRVASVIAKAGGVFSALLMAAMTLHVILEICLRAFFNSSTFVLDEFVGYGVAAMTFMTLGYALETNSLIRVNILLVRIRGDFGRRLVEVLCALVALTMSSFIALYFWKSVSRNFVRGVTSETMAEIPLWIPESLVLLGLGIFMIQLLAYILKVISGQSLLAVVEQE